MHRKKWKFTIPAVILALSMISATFFGALDLTYRPAYKDNTPQPEFVKDRLSIADDERPAKLQSADMVYDSESDKVILFGGATQNLQDILEDTWSYDYSTNTWTNMSPAIHPPAAQWSATAYESYK